MEMSRRQQILEVFKARLSEISRANEFQTDVGAKVFLGETFSLGPSDPDEIAALVPQNDQVGGENRVPKKLQITLPIDCVAVAKANLDEPWVRIEAVIADIKRAIEVDDRHLGGLASGFITRGSTIPMERQEGSQIVGAVVTYFVPYTEAWGAP